LGLACSVPPGVPEFLIGDPGRLRQIILNIVGNAIKFTVKGEVAVQVEVDSQGEDHVVLHFAVRDTGIGISPEKQQMIFGPFQQVDGSTTRSYGGAGLGLAITSHLVRLMGGRIWLESASGQGSTFHFTARFGLGHDSSAARWADFARLRNLPALVVDDNPTNRHLLVEVLNRWKMIPTGAEGGQHALDLLQRSKQERNPYAVILLDCQMPGVDGFAVAEFVKRDPELAGAVLLMVTSGGQPEDAARCRQLDIAAYLMKPVTQSELLEAILLAFETPSALSSPQPVTRHRLREECRGLRILLAEDNPVNQALIVRLLEKRGHRVEVARSGQEASELVEKAFSHPFNLLLIDMLTAEVDGADCVARIRTRENGSESHIPIIALTSQATKADCGRLLGFKVDGYVTEPFRAQEILETIEKILPARTNSIQPLGNEPENLLDGHRLLERFQGKKTSLVKLIVPFLNDCPKLLAAAREALLRNDGLEFQRVTKELRNRLALFSPQDAREAVGLTGMAGLAPSSEHGAEVLARLEVEIERLRPAVANLGKEVAP
jgi:CheY-like chemotaxis protein